MTADSTNSTSAAFNDKAEKIVNWEEWRNRREELYWQQLGIGEKLFQAFVDTPHKMYHFVRQSLVEAAQEIKRNWGKDNTPAPVRGYEDILSGDVYISRTSMEAETAYALKNGLSKKFQEKSANIARQAFEESRDFSVLKKNGQLRPFT